MLNSDTILPLEYYKEEQPGGGGGDGEKKSRKRREITDRESKRGQKMRDERVREQMSLGKMAQTQI